VNLGQSAEERHEVLPYRRLYFQMIKSLWDFSPVTEPVAKRLEKFRTADYYEVLQEQQLLFPAENSLVRFQLNQLLAVVQLYRALGGGWKMEATAVK
jgi:hypothetical protein